MKLPVLSAHDRIRIQAAMSRVRETGNPVRLEVEWDGAPMRVLLSRPLNKAAVLAQRSAEG